MTKHLVRNSDSRRVVRISEAKHVVRTSDDLPHDHWIARQLPAGTSLRSFAEDQAISELTSTAQEAIDRAGLTRTEVARVLGTTKSYVSQVLNGSTNMTLRTFGALLWAAGRQVRQVSTVPVGADVSIQPQHTVVVLELRTTMTRFISYTPDESSLGLVDHFNAHTHRLAPVIAR